MARVGFEAQGFGGGAGAVGVGAVAQAVGVLEEVELVEVGRGEVDVVGGGYGVVEVRGRAGGRHCCCGIDCGWVGLVRI